MRVAEQRRVVATYVAVTIVVAALGLWAGSLPRRQWARAPTTAAAPADSSTLRLWREWHDSLAEAFRDEVVGIQVGKPFPPLAISPFDTDSALSISQVLPTGGVIALVTADCNKCIQTAVALQAAVDSAGAAALPAIVLADAPEGAVAFAGELARRGVRIPLFCDRGTVLRTRHNVQGTMAWFRLDAQSRLVSNGFVFEPSVTRLREIVSEADSAASKREENQLP